MDNEPGNENSVKFATFTVGHTWLIVIGALALLWILGSGVFRSIRM